MPHVQENCLDGRQDHAGIGMLELRRHSFADMLRLRHVSGAVFREGRQDCHAAPFRALIEGHEQLAQRVRSNLEGLGFRRGMMDLRERRHRVGDHHGVRVGDHFLQHLQESVFQTHDRVQVEKLSDTDGGRLANVGRLVPESLAQGFLHIVDHLIHPDTAHRPDRQCSNKGIGVFGVLYEGIDGKDTEVGVRFGIVPAQEKDGGSVGQGAGGEGGSGHPHQVEVHEFLLLQIAGRDVLEDIGEKSGDILA